MKKFLRKAMAAVLSGVMVFSAVNVSFGETAEPAEEITEEAEALVEDETVSDSAVSSESEDEEIIVQLDDGENIDLSMYNFDEYNLSLDLWALYKDEFDKQQAEGGTGYTDILKNMTVSTVIDHLQYSDGSDASGLVWDSGYGNNIVWGYFKDENGKQIADKYRLISKDDVVDMTPPTNAGESGEYILEIIINGEGTPMSVASADRLIVKVFTNDITLSDFDYYIYSQKDGVRQKAEPNLVFQQDSEYLRKTLVENGYVDKAYADGGYVDMWSLWLTMFSDDEEIALKDLYLGFKFGLNDRPCYNVYVIKESETGLPFYVDNDGKLCYNEGGGVNMQYNRCINSRVLDVDMDRLDAGDKLFQNNSVKETYYFIITTDFSKVYPTDNREEVRQIRQYVFSMNNYSNSFDVMFDSMKINDNGVMKDVVYKHEYGLSNTDECYDGLYLYNCSESDNLYIKYKLEGNADAAWEDYVMAAFEGDYYEDLYSAYNKSGSSGLTSAVNSYTSSGKKNIKNELFGNGYKSSDYDRKYFTIVYYPNKASIPVTKKLVSADYLSAGTEKFNSVIIGESDPYLRLAGAEGYDSYVIENGGHYNMDTYYGYGYQTILIDDPDADLSKVTPIIKSGNEDIFKLYKITDGGSKLQDFDSPDNIDSLNSQYALAWQIDDTNILVRNYWLSVVKKQTGGGKLYVFGPENESTEKTSKGYDYYQKPREVVFGGDYDDYHDVFIANIGDKALRVTVTLNDAKNVKLDDYWTADFGELNAFETTVPSKSYGELDNVSKIRLVKDGDGEVSGNLVIKTYDWTTKEENNYNIPLSGKANPEIKTVVLSDAVKYVPYQSIIATDNHDSNNVVTYSLASGSLPKGVSLNSGTGEIYGVPLETGDFTFTVKADFSDSDFTSRERTLTLKVLENTDANVDAQTDEGFEITERVPNIVTDDANPITDQVFEFTYDYGTHAAEYQGFWLDGKKLEAGADYDVEAGSTKITLKAQTINNAGEGNHTIAGEYRNQENRVKKAAQNFSVTKNSSTSGGSTGGSGGSTSGGGSSGSSGGSSGGRSSGGGGGSSSSASYKVTFNTNGGAAVEAVSVRRNNKISFLPTPEKAGYVFDGWYTDAALTKEFDKNKAVTGNITLYAKWSQASCRVWFDTDGGSEVNSVEIMGDTKLENLPTPEKEGNTFGGWYTEDGKKFNEGDKIYSNTTLKALWIPDEAPENAAGFVDVTEDAWYYDDVNWAYGENLMVGYNNAIFAPDEAIKGSNVVTVLSKIMSADVEGYAEGTEGEPWYNKFVKWAFESGVTAEGFDPNKSVSREELAGMLYRVLKLSGAEVSGGEIGFDDKDEISAENAEAVGALTELGVIAGRDDNTFDPDGTTTRAEFAALIRRFEAAK